VHDARLHCAVRCFQIKTTSSMWSVMVMEALEDTFVEASIVIF
jgi:hypothetical protein